MTNPYQKTASPIAHRQSPSTCGRFGVWVGAHPVDQSERRLDGRRGWILVEVSVESVVAAA